MQLSGSNWTLSDSVSIITKTCLFKYIENFTSKKGEKKTDKNSDIFHISAQNIDCGYSLEPPRRGDSNEYPQSMFLSRNKKNNVYPCKPQFYYIKGGQNYIGLFSWWLHCFSTCITTRWWVTLFWFKSWDFCSSVQVHTRWQTIWVLTWCWY